MLSVSFFFFQFEFLWGNATVSEKFLRNNTYFLIKDFSMCTTYTKSYIQIKIKKYLYIRKLLKTDSGSMLLRNSE